MPLNAPLKKSGAGGHNWGWPGIEVGVELANKEELTEIDRIANPTAPEAGEEPQWDEYDYEEEEDNEEAEVGDWHEEQEQQEQEEVQAENWVWHIAGEQYSAGYWNGLDGVRTLFGDEPASDGDQAAELPHADFYEWISKDLHEDTSKFEAQPEKKNDEGENTVGGPPSFSETVAWADKEAEKAVFEGVPVVPWGEEPPKQASHDLPQGDTLAASRASTDEGGRLADDGPLGIEAERSITSRKAEAPANFNNKEIRTQITIDASTAAAMMHAAEVEKMEGEGGRSGTSFNIADTVSLS